MRPVAAEDADTLLAWRNDQATRTASLSTAEVPREEHVAWLARTFASGERELLIGEHDGVAIGTVRFDHRDGATSEVSITVAPEHRGKRLALPLLQAGLAAYAVSPRTRPRILAQIREHNRASRALFDAAGFIEIGRADGVLLLALDVV